MKGCSGQWAWHMRVGLGKLLLGGVQQAGAHLEPTSLVSPSMSSAKRHHFPASPAVGDDQ